MKNARILMSIIAVVVLNIFIIAGVCTAQQTKSFKKKWVMDVPTSGNYMTDLYQEWAKTIKEVSGGRLTIEVHMGSELGYKGTEHLQVIRDRLVDVVECRPFWVGGTEQYLNLTMLPYVGDTFGNQMFAVMIADHRMREIFNRYNAKVLTYQPHGEQCYWSKKPIKTIDDFRGVKVRVAGQMHLEAMKALGAEPLFIPWGDVYTSLQRGVMDAVVTSGMSAVEAKFWEVLKYVCSPNFGHAPATLLVNTKSWEELPDDIKVIVLQVSREIEYKLWLGARASERGSFETCKKHGMTVYKLSDDVIKKMRDRTRPIWDRWAQKVGPEGNAFIKTYLEYAE